MDESKFDATVSLEDVIDDPSKLTAAFEQAAEAGERRLWDDAEWTEPRWIHLKTIVTAFAHGILTADAWFEWYSLPPNFDVVMNQLAASVWFRWGKQDEVVRLSLLDIEAFYREFIQTAPFCQEWNQYAGSGFVTRYDAVPKERQFIDLDALVRNAAVFIRNEWRKRL
jgi:hypothetical protein